MKNYCVYCLLALSTSVNASTITTFSDRAIFDAAVGVTTLENFTDSNHFPIPGGSLSSTSSFGSLSAGDIQAGATYTTPVGGGPYFNIDSGGGFSGGFLDGLNPSDRDLTISYDPLISAFGFDTNSLVPDFDITINFLSGSSYINNFTGITNMQFFGFQSNVADIQSILISGNSNNFGFGFAIDNHSFGGNVSSVPAPAALWLFGFGLIMLTGMRKKSLKLSDKYA